MNYLAHLFLARHSADAMIGGLLGDFAKGSIECYPCGIRRGIQLHRAIDRYTDAHALVRASRGLVSPTRRRYAGIMVDVFFDHFLARHWTRFADTPLDEFTLQAYSLLLPRRADFPERLQRVLPRMADDDWLGSYKEYWAVDAAINGISRRFRRANPLAGGAREMLENYASLQENFLRFFPEILRFVNAARDRDAATEEPLRETGT